MPTNTVPSYSSNSFQTDKKHHLRRTWNKLVPCVVAGIIAVASVGCSSTDHTVPTHTAKAVRTEQTTPTTTKTVTTTVTVAAPTTEQATSPDSVIDLPSAVELAIPLDDTLLGITDNDGIDYSHKLVDTLRKYGFVSSTGKYTQDTIPAGDCEEEAKYTHDNYTPAGCLITVVTTDVIVGDSTANVVYYVKTDRFKVTLPNGKVLYDPTAEYAKEVASQQ